MMIEEKLKNLIIERYGSMVEFSKAIDMPNSTLATIMSKGIHKANVQNIIKICQALEISTDELAHDKIVPSGKQLQSRHPMTDIEEIIEYTKMNISTYSDLTYKGNPLTEDDKCMLLDALELCMEFISRRHKRLTGEE